MGYEMQTNPSFDASTTKTKPRVFMTYSNPTFHNEQGYTHSSKYDYNNRAYLVSGNEGIPALYSESGATSASSQPSSSKRHQNGR